MKDLEKLYEKYKFDFICINPKDIDNVNFEYIPEEILIDHWSPPAYIGKVKLNEKLIEVYFDKKITPGDVIFKYKTIQKERLIKLDNLKDYLSL